MEKNEKRSLISGTAALLLFVIWTWMIQTVDVKPVGQNGTDIGFAKLNVWFHSLTGVHMNIYTVTDWLGLVPIFICMVFGVVGFIQLIKRKSLFKVDTDLILLGVYYILVIAGYIIFEMIPINYRPVLIEGRMEASYPSSTTLLVLSVMPTLWFQTKLRVKNKICRYALYIFAGAFSAFMVIGRTVAGVHWLTDILGSVFLSTGLYLIYQGAALTGIRKKSEIKNGVS